ncbi:MAG: HpcH/HpaI aldolase/citrate lyase family protein [Nocardioides sp.]
MPNINSIRHFSWLSSEQEARLFHQAPLDFPRQGELERLAVALGATLYMPATRPTIAHDLQTLAGRGVVSAVLCLEDAIPDAAIRDAERNLVSQLRDLAAVVTSRSCALPLVFIRVREASQIARVVEDAGDASALVSGFVLPKFSPETGREYLDEVRRIGTETSSRYLSMPVLESAAVLHLETRQSSLLRTRDLLQEFSDHVLAVRLGATDLLAVYGLRRARDITVYEIPLLAHALADVVNVLGRLDDGHVVTGPVWEYFAASDRLFKPQLRQTPFEMRHASQLRQSLLTRDLDGLIREAVLDRANGLTGKTVIHPSHVLPIHALSVVSFEEYKDAVDVIEGLGSGGVSASSFGNKMNEGKPHAAWAQRTLLRAEVFGVAAPDVTFVEFLQAGDDLLGA